MAIIGTTVLSVDDRFDRANLLLGGVDLPKILSVSTNFQAAGLRRYHFRTDPSLKRDKELYRQRIQSHFHFDPSLFAHERNKDKILMVISTRDRIVPTEQQLKLWELLGRPERINTRHGHTSAILSGHTRVFNWIPYYESRIERYTRYLLEHARDEVNK